MAYNPAGGSTYTLQSSITSTQTTITLTSFTEPVSGTPYTMVLLNTDIVYATIGPKTSSSEFISFTGITQNSDGTATLTGVTRGLSKKYPFTENSTFKLPHSGQTTFILSDAPQVFNKYAALSNDNIFTGQNEVPTPLDDSDIANKGYVDAIVNGGTVSNNRIVVAGVAGETITIGQHLYYKTSDARWWKTDADDATITYGVLTGIAQGAGTAGNNVTNGILLSGVDTNNTGTAGATVYIGNTAGALSESVGTNTRAVGKYLPALAGLYYNPNMFVKYPQNTQSTYGVDSVGTDAYAVTLTPAPGSYTDGMTVTFKAGTANTGSCTLNVNGLGAKTIKKFGSFDTVTGDIASGQDVTVIYDGTNFQMQTPTATSTPVVNVYSTAATILGTSTTRFDITNSSGTTYRYTFDGTGTDPGFSAVNNPVGSLIYFSCQNFTAANNGLFVVTGSGSNYVEVTNASGVSEVDKTIGTGFVQRQTAVAGTYTPSPNAKYAIVEVQSSGAQGGTGTESGATDTYGGGGGGGGYAKKLIAISSLSSSNYFIVPPAIPVSTNIVNAIFGLSGTIICASGTPGSGSAGGVGGTATGGDLNIPGSNGNNGGSTSNGLPGIGGSSFFGNGQAGAVTNSTGVNAGNYGAGGTGGGGSGANFAGGTGSQGIIIITEYYV